MTYIRLLRSVRSLALAASASLALVAGCGNPMMNPGGDGGTGGCPPGGETLADVKASVFHPSCALSSSCHNAAGASVAGMLDLETDPYHALVGASTFLDSAKADFPKRVVAGDVMHSFLVKKVTLPGISDPKYGLRMPNTGQTVAADQLQKMECWIMAGAPNN